MKHPTPPQHTDQEKELWYRKVESQISFRWAYTLYPAVPLLFFYENYKYHGLSWLTYGWGFCVLLGSLFAIRIWLLTWQYRKGFRDNNDRGED